MQKSRGIPNAVTQASGVFANCGPGVNTFSLQYHCGGPACSSISSFQNIQCNADGGRMSCSNGISCPAGIASFISNFTFTQNDADPWNPASLNERDSLVQQEQHVAVASCAKFSLLSNGTREDTRIDGGSMADEKECPKVQETPSLTATALRTKKTSSIVFPANIPTSRPQPELVMVSRGSKHETPRILSLLALALSFLLLLPGSEASRLPTHHTDLQQRAHHRVREVSDKVRVFAQDFSAELADKANALGENGDIFAHNLVADIVSSVCDAHFSSDDPGSFTPSILKDCVKSVYGGERLPQAAGQFFTVFGASLLCDYVVSEAYPLARDFFPGACESLRDLARKKTRKMIDVSGSRDGAGVLTSASIHIPDARASNGLPSSRKRASQTETSTLDSYIQPSQASVSALPAVQGSTPNPSDTTINAATPDSFPPVPGIIAIESAVPVIVPSAVLEPVFPTPIPNNPAPLSSLAIATAPISAVSAVPADMLAFLFSLPSASPPKQASTQSPTTPASLINSPSGIASAVTVQPGDSPPSPIPSVSTTISVNHPEEPTGRADVPTLTGSLPSGTSTLIPSPQRSQSSRVDEGPPQSSTTDVIFSESSDLPSLTSSSSSSSATHLQLPQSSPPGSLTAPGSVTTMSVDSESRVPSPSSAEASAISIENASLLVSRSASPSSDLSVVSETANVSLTTASQRGAASSQRSATSEATSIPTASFSPASRTSPPPVVSESRVPLESENSSASSVPDSRLQEMPSPVTKTAKTASLTIPLSRSQIIASLESVVQPSSPSSLVSTLTSTLSSVFPSLSSLDVGLGMVAGSAASAASASTVSASTASASIPSASTASASIPSASMPSAPTSSASTPSALTPPPPPLCPSTLPVLCAGQCVDTQTNRFHCGGCSISCKGQCASGVCFGGSTSIPAATSTAATATTSSRNVSTGLSEPMGFGNFIWEDSDGPTAPLALKTTTTTRRAAPSSASAPSGFGDVIGEGSIGSGSPPPPSPVTATATTTAISRAVPSRAADPSGFGNFIWGTSPGIPAAATTTTTKTTSEAPASSATLTNVPKPSGFGNFIWEASRSSSGTTTTPTESGATVPGAIPTHTGPARFGNFIWGGSHSGATASTETGTTTSAAMSTGTGPSGFGDFVGEPSMGAATAAAATTPSATTAGMARPGGFGDFHRRGIGWW